MQKTRTATIAVALNTDTFQQDGPKWVQVTREGNFPGYLGGLKPFAFTRADLDQMVDNLRAHPSYSPGPDGVGAANVIPWDFNHASESHPTDGSLPAGGAPAQGWTLEMEVRDGDDGHAELWALTQFLEPARSYVKAGQYQWASVAVTFGAIHPDTGKNIGAVVTSIALTNTPFVTGMDKLAASASGGKKTAPGTAVALRRTWFEPARDASDAIGMMREMFSLPETAGAAEVMAQVAIVAQWIASGTAPLGTNPEELVGNMRTILNLPALSSQAMVLEEASKSIQALLEEQSTGAPAPTDGDGMVPEPDLVAAGRKGNDDMDPKTLKKLAVALGVRESEDAVVSAVEETAKLRDGLVALFGLSRDGNQIILAAAKEGAGAREKLSSLLKALGVADGDVEVAMNKLAKTMEDAKRLGEVMPELQELKVAREQAEEAAIEADVDDAIAASGLAPSLKGALLLQRKTDPEGFKASFPKRAGAAPAARPDLTVKVAASGTAPVQAPGASPAAGGPDKVNLAMYGAPNPTAAAKMHLAATHSGWDKLTDEAKHVLACNFKKQDHVVFEAIN